MKALSRKAKQVIFLLSLPVIGFGLWLYYKFNPLEHAIFPPCPFHYSTGYHCPGCGTQRAFHALLHGHFLEAIRYNLLLILAFLVLLYKVYLVFFNKRESSSNLLYKNSTPWIILFLVVGFWILRNIPVEPFVWLAP